MKVSFFFWCGVLTCLIFHSLGWHSSNHSPPSRWKWQGPCLWTSKLQFYNWRESANWYKCWRYKGSYSLPFHFFLIFVHFKSTKFGKFEVLRINKSLHGIKNWILKIQRDKGGGGGNSLKSRQNQQERWDKLWWLLNLRKSTMYHGTQVLSLLTHISCPNKSFFDPIPTSPLPAFPYSLSQTHLRSEVRAIR